MGISYLFYWIKWKAFSLSRPSSRRILIGYQRSLCNNNKKKNKQMSIRHVHYLSATATATATAIAYGLGSTVSFPLQQLPHIMILALVALSLDPLGGGTGMVSLA